MEKNTDKKATKKATKKEEKDPKEENKDSPAKEGKEVKTPKDPKEGKDAKDTKDAKGSKDSKEKKEKEVKDAKETKETVPDSPDAKDPKKKKSSKAKPGKPESQNTVDNKTELEGSPEKPVETEPQPVEEEKDEQHEDEEVELIEVEEEEVIPEEEWAKIKLEWEQNKAEDDNVEPPRTRIVKKMIERKKVKAVPEEPEENKEDLCIQFIKDKIDINAFQPEHWTQEHSKIIMDFLHNPNDTKIFFWVEENGLKHSINDPPLLKHDAFDNEFVYFLKNTHEKIPITADNISGMIFYGIVGIDDLKYILKVMKSQYIPAFLNDQTWPENVKKEFISEMHKFMASTTETAFQRDGQTRLYLPKENLSNTKTTPQDKELIQRLESTILFWNKQIREIINNPRTQNDSELAGPLDEIKYWRLRQENLSSIQKQIESPELQKILEILKKSESNHVKLFEENFKQIKDGNIEADNNLKYLKSLQAPCKELEEANIKDIPKILPQLLHRVRMIAEYSQHYNSTDAISGLLIKISNEIIKRCKKQIDLDELLEGNVEKCIQDLEDSIQCGKKWEEIYQKMENLINKKGGGKKWDFNNQGSIFAQIQAFGQRCNDLKEICEGQLQFARKGADNQMPIFGGTKGIEILQLLEENRSRFKKHLDKIKETKQETILDIKSTKWHDDYAAFKNGMKDLDNMYQTIINQAFNNITTVEQGVEMLEAFDSLAKRSSIKLTVQKKANYVLELFNKEIEKAKTEYEKVISKPESYRLTYGKYSGPALWVRSLVHRMEKLKEAIEKLTFIENQNKKQTLEAFNTQINHFKQQLKQKFQDWSSEGSKDADVAALEAKLNHPILISARNVTEHTKTKNVERNRLKPDHIESNFDKTLMRLLIEVRGWDKIVNQISKAIPNHYLEFVQTKRDQLRIHREHVMLVVRDYNQVYNELEENVILIDPENKKYFDIKKLFARHLQDTKAIISQGENRIKFSSKNVLERTVRECQRSCERLRGYLELFKNNTKLIYDKCKKISDEMFISLGKKEPYDVPTFEAVQAECRKKVQARIKALFDEIKNVLSEIYDLFYLQNDEDIQKTFFEYVDHIDKKIEESLKKAIKFSLVDFNRTINGDSKKSDPIPTFRLAVKYESGKIFVSPAEKDLQDKVKETMAAMTETLSNFPRMEELVKEDRIKKLKEFQAQKEDNQQEKQKKVDFQIKPLPESIEKKRSSSFYEMVSEEKEIKALTDKILKGLKLTCASLSDKLNIWRQKIPDYTIPKDKFAILLAHDALSSLQTQVEQAGMIIDDIISQRTTLNVECIQLDHTKIKEDLTQVLNDFQNTLLNTIKSHALKDLNDFYDLFKTSAQSLGVTPMNPKDLKINMDSYKILMDEKPAIETKLTPIEEKFRLLQQYGQTFTPEENEKKKNLREQWDEFNKMLDRVRDRNQRKYAEMENETYRTIEEFAKESENQKLDFLGKAPFTTNNLDNEKAFVLLNEFKEQVKILRGKENGMKTAINVFKIQQPPNPDLDYVEKEIENLEKAWGLKDEWERKWHRDISKIKFKDFNKDDLEELVDDYIYRVNSFSKEMKKWEVVNSLRTELDNFKKSLLFVESLRSEAMQDRNWERLKSDLKRMDLNHKSENFDLGEVFKLGLLQWGEVIIQNVNVAKNEYDIEKKLRQIEEEWGKTDLDTEKVANKEFFKLRKPEKVNDLLERNNTALSSMKTNPYAKYFEGQILNWEKTLTKVAETLELLMQVQRQWIYLESIFSSQAKDQFKQLIGDISQFNHLDERFRGHLDRINKTRNALTCLIYEGFQNDLADISRKFEIIQKILLQLLELKRKDFSRFYFLSDDDLFELLGQAKEPDNVNKHIKKCFEGIKRIDVETENHPKANAKFHKIIAMNSPDGEKIMFQPKNVPVEHGVESWLGEVVNVMRITLKTILHKCDADMPTNRKKDVKWVSKWVQDYPGQLLILALQMRWTREIEDALSKELNDDTSKNKALKPFKEYQKQILDELTNLVRTSKTEIDRLKIVSMITIELHAKSVLEDLWAKRISSPKSFEWESQLRFFEEREPESLGCKIRQTNTVAPHGFEYQGNNGRLVITPLTDRCYLTLTTAMHLKKGGAPQGPAGTGKTETVKDLGKGMGKFVLVFNCSEGLEYKSLGRMFSGLVQSGGWGCFDEFNRIEVEVLSVVATQISSIFNALRAYQTDQTPTHTFNFEGETIKINKDCGIFITMNPTYAGRSELPDNLKSLFRPIAMIVPNSELIAEVMLASEGFKPSHTSDLAKKIITLYNLMKQQLSKQDHYDFGLRAIKSVLNCAGAIRRSIAPVEEKKGKDKEKDKDAIPRDEEKEERIMLMKAVLDMNMPKFVSNDIPLFDALFKDLFKDEDEREAPVDTFRDAIEDELKANGYQIHDQIINKVVQLYDSKNTRHGNMLVGSSLSGKTTCWKILEKTLNRLSKTSNKFQSVRTVILNPKSIDLKELYGYVDRDTNEWHGGVLSYLMSDVCKEESDNQRWMILDGPVDTLWVESLNTVLDDNKLLTLLSGDRIVLPPQVGLIFEVEDLSVASPATVSRCGMVYLDINELGWEPYVDSWVETKKDPELRQVLSDLFYRWIPVALKAKKMCKELIPCSDINLVTSLCRLLDALNQHEPAIKFENPPKTDEHWLLVEKWFAFALLWSVGATVDENGRKIIDYKFRDVESFFPVNNVYDYYINPEKGEFSPWEDKLNSAWKPAAGAPFHKMLVQTVDTQRNKYILSRLIEAKVNTLVVGVTGVGKTALIDSILSLLDDSKYCSFSINFSAQTTSAKTQEIFESKLKPVTKTKMRPDGSKKAVCFIDDLNMPRKEKFGAQPPLELLRQFIDYEGWFDRQNLASFKSILDVQLIAAMGPPGGGRAEISKRLQSRFNLVNFTFPNDSQIKRIYQSILSHHFASREFDEEIRGLAEPLIVATINLYKNIENVFKPTPTRSHYVFNLRDISKIIQGICQVDKYYCDTKISLFRIWVHECLRIFHDRMIDEDDRAALKKFIGDKLENELQSNYKEIQTGEDDPVYVDFLDNTNLVYREVTLADREKLKEETENYLKNYNSPGRVPMDIVLFNEAIINVCKIHRIIKLSRGHAMLVGDGGSGRHSLTRLATFIADYKEFKAEIKGNTTLRDFREQIKKFCEEVGTKKTPATFLFSDNEIVTESFVEDVNSLISAGEVPNLFTKEEVATMRDKCKRQLEKEQKDLQREGKIEKDAKVIDDDAAWTLFQNRVQSNLHVIFCMSKSGDNLRNLTRMYPGLVNNTTIIWFMPWPEEALYEVAGKFLKHLEFEAPLQKSIQSFFSGAHSNVILDAKRMLNELKRVYYVTPTNYIELVKGYVDLLQEKRTEIGNEINKLSVGLNRLEQAQQSSAEIEKKLEVAHSDLTQKQKDCEDLMIKATQSQREADEKQKEVEVNTAIVEKDQTETEKLANDAQLDLQKAMPALLEASQKIDMLSSKQFAEVKAYSSPPPEVGNVLAVILIYLGHSDTSWASAKKVIADSSFLNQLKEFGEVQKDNITRQTLNKVEKFTSRADMDPGRVYKISEAAGCLWDWCLAMEKYAKAFRDIEPKRNKVKVLEEKLKKSRENLFNLQENYRKLKEEIAKTNEMKTRAENDMEKYKQEAGELKVKLERANKLVFSLGSSKDSWFMRRKNLQEQYDYLIGDVLLSAAFLSYSGPFPSEYRKKLLDNFMDSVKNLKIPNTRRFNFADFMAAASERQKWNGQELPSDQFSIENGILVTKGRRFPLMIDPQLQGSRWIKNMEREKLQILDPLEPNYMNVIEKAIVNGLPILFQNVGEEIDPSLELVLNKSINKIGDGRYSFIIGEKEIIYNPNFRLYLTTKFSNPKYKAEISAKVTLVNFIVKEDGLEEQLLNKLIENLEPTLEKSRKEMIKKKAENENMLKELDDKVLRLLRDTEGSLVEDDNLIKTLQSSKEKEDETKTFVEQINISIKKTNDLRNNYRPLGTKASVLFFALNDLNKIDHMYQFSLESYINEFVNSITKPSKEKQNVPDSRQDKLDNIEKEHKRNIYSYACRSLFQKDKLLFSMQMAVRLAQLEEDEEKKINQEEYDFFLRGAGQTDKSQQPPNPGEGWISQNAWDNICELDKRIPMFQNLVGSFIHNTRDWQNWYRSSDPIEALLPSDWSAKCDELRKMILIKLLRPDRITFACRNFIISKLKSEEFVNSQIIPFSKVYESSRANEPIIIILSPGVDPFSQIEKLADEQSIKLVQLSLGQGQAKVAREKISEGVKSQYWVYLANCHLSLGFLTELEKVLDSLKIDEKSTFRLWLTTNPTPKFPISILQRSLKVTTEPPKGIKANMLRLYYQMKEEPMKAENKKHYKKLLWCLSWFHSIVIERKKFKNLGWNISYDFNDSDFEICENIIRNYLEQNTQKNPVDFAKNIQWEAIRYLIAEANYGGRVTDQCDRDLLLVYAKECFNERVLTDDRYKLADYDYYVPDDDGFKLTPELIKNLVRKDELAFYEIKINDFSNIDPPSAFGQHDNAEIAAQISDSNILLDSILALQPRKGAQGADDSETTVKETIEKLLENEIPEQIDMDEVYEKTKMMENDDPLKIVLLQEIERYNKLLSVVRLSLENLRNGIEGKILISEELERVMFSLYENKVPEAWKFAYHSLKPLTSWIIDLKKRVDMMKTWAMKGAPTVYWISGFTYPTGFTTAILQISARRQGKSIDNVFLDFYFNNSTTKAPSDGAYVSGLYLEGAKWDADKPCLVEAETMKLHYEMPVIHFKPQISYDGKKTKKATNFYQCPTYMYPVRRSDGERPSFMFYVNLPCGSHDAGFWAKRGTALLMSLSD